MKLGLSLGLGRRVGGSAAPPAQQVEPSAQWNGTAGAGFGGSNPAAPTDPTRTTAKPVLRLLQPDFQAYTDELLVGVFAAANNAGSLYDNLGIEKVTFYYEGATVDVTAPSIQTFDDANGNSRSYLGWWVRLKHPGTNGFARLYVEATAKDVTMQKRVIGPYLYNPQATLYDKELTIAPSLAPITGERYQTVRAAFEWLRSQSFNYPRLTVTEAGSHVLSRPTFGNPAANGWITVEASVPGVVFDNAAGDPLGMWLNVNQWRFKGSNITFDFQTVRDIYHNTTQARDYWFDGVNFTVSGGRYTLVNGNADQPYIRGENWFTECQFTNGVPALFSQLVRGATFNNHWADLANNAFCVIDNRINGADSREYTAPINALTVSYSGAEATATIAISGVNNANGRVVTLKYGANTATWTVNNSNPAGGFYTVSDLVAWINTVPGFTATLLDNTRRAASLTKVGAASFGAFADTDVKTAPLTLITAFDIHSDFYQQQNGINADNSVIWGNTGSGIEDMQMFLFQPTGVGARDVLVANNAFETANGTPFATQFQQSLNHFMFVHNTLVEQNMLLRADLGLALDSYSLIANNVAEAFSWSGTSFATSALADNHLYVGATAPANSTGTTIGGTSASLFADAAEGNFTPQGELLTNLKASRLSRDLNKSSRASSAVAGAVA